MPGRAGRPESGGGRVVAWPVEAVRQVQQLQRENADLRAELAVLSQSCSRLLDQVEQLKGRAELEPVVLVRGPTE